MVRPKLLELAKDSSDLVRELLADHLIKLAPVLGKQQTIDLLLEPLLALLRDRTPEVLSTHHLVRIIHHDVSTGSCSVVQVDDSEYSCLNSLHLCTMYAVLVTLIWL